MTTKDVPFNAVARFCGNPTKPLGIKDFLFKESKKHVLFLVSYELSFKQCKDNWREAKF
jgi:hypothetical protein